jgi:Leucine-rich repeat (LRR) protein
MGEESTIQPPPPPATSPSSEQVHAVWAYISDTDGSSSHHHPPGSDSVIGTDHQKVVLETLSDDGFTNHQSQPIGVPSENEGDIEAENNHSLPTPEELKSKLPTSSRGGVNVCLSRPKGFFVFLFLCLAAVIIGLSVGLTQNQQKTETYHGGDKRLYHMQEYLIVHGVTNRSDLEASTNSPQFNAVDWLAHDDTLVIGIPTGDLTTDSGYDFVTRYVMAVFYYSTNGQSWNFDLSFLSGKSTCEWYQVFAAPVGEVGVLCNQNTRKVVGFSLISNNVEGTLPTELSQLTTITYVESIANAITGTIPSQLQNLSNLRTFVLAFSSLSGTIPVWINMWEKLELLYLSNNFLTGFIPSAIGELSALSVLALDDNELKGSIEVIWRLNNLEYLYLEDNSFTGTLPSEIETRHPLLVNLDLSDNELRGRLPKDIFRLKRLEILDLHNNQFTGAIPDDINADNERLSFVALYKNKFNGSIPETMGNLRELKHLDLSENSLTGRLPFELDYLSDLTYLFLGGNNYTKGVIPTWVYSLDKMRELSLKSSNLGGTISELLGVLDKLILLDLDDNDLSGTIPSEIGYLTSLEFLLLNRNELTKSVPTELGSLSALST